MKVVFTGGKTGGHFYPLLAIAEELYDLADQEHILEVKCYFFSNTPYDVKSLSALQIEYEYIPAGQVSGGAMFTGLIATVVGVLTALWKLFWIFPDVVVSKGAYVSIPTVFAAHLLRIPIIIHESDVVPGRANLTFAKWAHKIAVSYPEAAKFFDAKKVACTGQPIRRGLRKKTSEGAREYLGLSNLVPVVWILGGSSGAKIINDTVLTMLEKGLYQYQIVHQVGIKNEPDMRTTVDSLLADHPHKDRYHLLGYMDALAMTMTAGVADLIVTRAGSTLFEIALWEVPAIVIPISDSFQDHQRKDAYAYASSGSAVVIEEENLTDDILLSEISRIVENKDLNQKMRTACQGFSRKDAAKVIAEEIIAIVESHEPVIEDHPVTIDVLEKFEADAKTKAVQVDTDESGFPTDLSKK